MESKYGNFYLKGDEFTHSYLKRKIVVANIQRINLELTSEYDVLENVCINSGDLSLLLYSIDNSF